MIEAWDLQTRQLWTKTKIEGGSFDCQGIAENNVLLIQTLACCLANC